MQPFPSILTDKLQYHGAGYFPHSAAEILAHLRANSNNVAILNCEGLEIAVHKKGNEYVVNSDVELNAVYGDAYQDEDGIGQGWTPEQALSAPHNPDGPEPFEVEWEAP